jgi:branched-chain amino acid aminotransferase
METINSIPVLKTKFSRLPQINWNQLEFGKEMSDHMFFCKFSDGEWQRPRIVPFGDLRLSPATLALHYGQSVFEGMKSFYLPDGSINIFRMQRHHERLNRSLYRMCMPVIPEELFTEGLEQLMRVDRAWVPKMEGSALYIRPFVFASESRFGVKVSDEYQFIIFSGPVAPIYPKPLRVKIERQFIRAAKGGTGAAKCSGNYGGSFYPTQLARQEGFDQVLWTDAGEHEYIEESGTMNVMFVIGGTLVTPPLSDSILDGVTRDSLLTLANDLGIPAEERMIGVHELKEAFEKGTLTEAFGAGTAAVVAPIASFSVDGEEYSLPAVTNESVQTRLREKMDAIRYGKEEDAYGWNTLV